ncbi:MAG TPA: ATP-binding protein [Actinomycetota bacterium]|nr:ATP-binding protein [Actinomycetota bacterium]
MTIRVMVADDERMIRESLGDLIGESEGMELVGLASDAEEAIALARETEPDVALLDVKMPGGGGARAAREIRTASAKTRILALSAYEETSVVMEMLRAGAFGYIVKGASGGEVIDVIGRAVRGHASLAPEITADVIHELLRLLERSETLSEELADLNQTKSDLVQIIAHELLTPVTIIHAFAQSVLTTNLPPEALFEMAAGVARASDRIKRLVGNISAAAAMDMAGVRVNAVPTTLQSVIDDALAQFPNQKGQFTTSIENPHGRIWADPPFATQALVIVVENGIAFSPEGLPVRVSARARGAMAEISVIDEGPGIPEGMRGQIFEPFQQADASTTREHQGIGLGLYLARKIVEAHQGTITLESPPEGGANFRLTFPALDESTSADGAVFTTE